MSLHVSGHHGSNHVPRGWIARLVLLLLATSSPFPVAAGPLSIYGFNPRGMAMGEAQVAAADDGSAAFHNPALLARQGRPSFMFGAQIVRPSLWVEPVEMTFREDHLPEFPDDYIQWNLGFAIPLGGKLEERLAVGFAMSLPQDYIVRVQSIDTATPQFPIYQSSARKLTLMPAVAYRPWSLLSVGVGLQTLASFVGGADIEVDLFTRRVRQRTMLVDLLTRRSWTSGVALGPFNGLLLGVSFRQELGLDYVLPARLDIEDVGILELRLEGVGLWSPHELSFGAAFEIPGLPALLSLDFTYGWWSRSPSPQAVAMLDTSGDVLEGLGLGEAFDLCSDIEVIDEETGARTCLPISPGYADNVVPKLGLELRPSEPLVLRAGYRYWPTPVPNQVGRTNYLDASSHHLSLGLGYGLRDPLEVFSRPVLLEAALHVIRMHERAVDKGGDGRVAYTFGGSLFQASVAVRYQF